MENRPGSIRLALLAFALGFVCSAALFPQLIKRPGTACTGVMAPSVTGEMIFVLDCK